MSKIAFGIVYDKSPLGAVTSRDRAALRTCLTALQDNVHQAPALDAISIAINRFIQSVPCVFNGVLSAAFTVSSPAARAVTDTSGVVRVLATPVELVAELITDSVLVLPQWTGDYPLRYKINKGAHGDSPIRDAASAFRHDSL